MFISTKWCFTKGFDVFNVGVNIMDLAAAGHARPRLISDISPWFVAVLQVIREGIYNI